MNPRKISASLLTGAVILTAPGPGIYQSAAEENIPVVPEIAAETSFLGESTALQVFNPLKAAAAAVAVPEESVHYRASQAPVSLRPMARATPLPGDSPAPAKTLKSKFLRARKASQEVSVQVGKELITREAGSDGTEGSERESPADAHRRWSRFYDFGGSVSGSDSSSPTGGSNSAAGYSSGSGAAARLQTKEGNNGSGDLIPDPKTLFPYALKAAIKRTGDPNLGLVYARYESASGIWKFSFQSDSLKRAVNIPISPSWAVLPGIEENDILAPGPRIDIEKSIPLARIIEFKSPQWESSPDEVTVIKRSADSEANYEFTFPKGVSPLGVSPFIQNAEAFEDAAQLIGRDLQELKRDLRSIGAAVKDVYFSGDKVVVSVNDRRDEKTASEYLAGAVRWKLLLRDKKMVVSSGGSPRSEPEPVQRSGVLAWQPGNAGAGSIVLIVPGGEEIPLKSGTKAIDGTLYLTRYDADQLPGVLITGEPGDGVFLVRDLSKMAAPAWTEEHLQQFVSRFDRAIKKLGLTISVASEISGFKLPGPTIVIWFARGTSREEAKKIVETRVPAAKPIPGRRPIIYWPRP